MTKQCVTIYTDASFCPTTKIGGWACWVKWGQNEGFKHYGTFKQHISGSNYAEMGAIANAIFLTSTRVSLGGKTLVVVTDSATAKTLIEMGTSKNAELRRMVKSIQQIVPSNCTLKINKVKAHSST